MSFVRWQTAIFPDGKHRQRETFWKQTGNRIFDTVYYDTSNDVRSDIKDRPRVCLSKPSNLHDMQDSLSFIDAHDNFHVGICLFILNPALCFKLEHILVNFKRICSVLRKSRDSQAALWLTAAFLVSIKPAGTPTANSRYREATRTSTCH
ncbi:LAME_0D02432g1_1 [Lachancea meyersii CBS 8951]|uniref:LAME_0D02432g1_1 n=1 Tax=Lachancea meyersii CBS 8951 TaxID=1266667 RepID=A0A1G4J7B7_9SACH|nr:LAME_0D02432g1_1 [Lachancea meyersii CBS 8951]